MHEFFSREPDPLEGMLRPPSPPDNEELRQALYPRTRHALWQRRRWRRLAYGAELTFFFAMGLLAGWLAMLARAPTPAPEPEAPVPIAKKEEPPAVKPPPVSDESALTQEWIAFDSVDQRGERYRQAADRYLTEENDPQSALRCISNALDGATEQDLSISTDDNYLLMAIKHARQKENDHAKQGG